MKAFRRSVNLLGISVASSHTPTMAAARWTSSSSNGPTEDLYKPIPGIPESRGIDIIKDARSDKGMAFSMKERQIMGLHGLLPPRFMTQEEQVFRVMENLRKMTSDLDRYIFLNSLQDRNEKLFYRVLVENVDQLIPIVYTPTVGEVCRKFGFIYQTPKGLYITIHDRKLEHIHEILRNWPEPKVRAIVVTDGERILGLGDLGAHGMGIPVGKLALYCALAGIQPKWCLPIMLDVGTDNERLLNDPFYIGLKHKRIRGPQYDELIDNFMAAVVKRYGQETLIQFEDFGNQNAFRLLEKYQNSYCTFNDDIQGTASVVLAGLLTATRITGHPLADNKYLFYGAGEASIGIAQLMVMAMMEEGISEAEAKAKIWLVDSKGLIVSSRTDISEHKRAFAQDFKPMNDLGEIVEELKPSALLGSATIPQSFTEWIIRAMSSFNQRPMIFALSNPASKSECTAQQAYNWSDGRAVFISGSPFDPVKSGSEPFYHSQGNNSYIFPGVALGATTCGVHHIPNKLFLIASQTLANLVTNARLAEGQLYPPLKDCQEISIKIATEVANYCYEKGLGSFYPEPHDKEAFIRAQLYDPTYDSFVPEMYDWPKELMST